MGPKDWINTIKKFRRIWASFTRVAKECKKFGGKIAIEWPVQCDYWNWPMVKDLVDDYELLKVNITGCSLGLTDDNGVPMRKGWTIATNDKYIREGFADKHCPGKDVHPYHAKVEGKYTKKTEEYTDEMVGIIHKSWKRSVRKRDNEFTSKDQIKHNKLRWIDVPAMPVTRAPVVHREKITDNEAMINALVVRTVNRKEMMNTPAALKAMEDEFNKLANQKVWLIETVREKEDVRREAIKGGFKVHFGQVFGICGEKGSELPAGSPGRKFKGRYVFRGNEVRDEYSQIAIFDELSSSPATLEASKAVDAYGCFPGNDSEQCDAEQAYVQSELGGTETWVSLPKDKWPKSWHEFRNPVCKLKLSLYGHPDAGGYWEAHCKQKLIAGGFQLIPDWPSMYWHKTFKLLLMVYVDDFKMSGPKDNLKKGWGIIRKDIKLTILSLLVSVLVVIMC